MEPNLDRRAAMHAALGEPARLAIVDSLLVTDRSPKDLGQRHGLPTNLLAHHLAVLEAAGLVSRFVSAGDRRRKYVALQHLALTELSFTPTAAQQPGPMVFLCSQNSARSQLAAALWTARTGQRADSAGTHPAARVHRGAMAAAKRAGLDLSQATPRTIGALHPGAQVVTVCDQAHEQLDTGDEWWHWSTPDPVPAGTAAAFDAVVATLDERIHTLID